MKLDDYKIFRDDKTFIEPEEVFFDAEVNRNFGRADADFATSKIEVPLGFKDFLIPGLFGALAISIMFFYNFYFQIFSSDKFLAQAESNSSRIQSIKAPRGIIYDRNLKELVSNEPSFDIIMTPKDLPEDAETQNAYAEKLSSIIGVSADELKEAFKARDRMSILPAVLKENLDKNSAFLLEAQIESFSGIKVEKNAVRNYKYGQSFSHILGYTSKISAEELERKRGYLATDYIGKMGVEQSYEDFLKGKNGEYVIHINAKHDILKEGIEEEPEAGKSIVLSIDAKFQKFVYDLLDRTSKELKTGAAFVAIDPRNGKILSLVSAPSYDNNLFSHGISYKNYNSLINDPLKPLFNRAVAGKYPPGSSIKPFIGLAALEENVITPERQILSTGSIVIGSNPETAYVFKDWKEGGHGWVDIYKAIAQSVNTYFYTVGGGYDDVRGLGISRIIKYLSLFGFNSATGIDVIGESAGFIPSEEWKKEKLNEEWYVGDTYNASIGQGYISVTPLQLANSVAYIANGSILYKPRLVERVLNTDKEIVEEFDSEILRRDFIKNKNVDIIRRAMRETVVSGSARSLSALPMEVAGKTGTAQFGKGKNTHAWFSGFAPYNNPEIAFVVLVEGGGEGSSVAVPIAYEILKWWHENGGQK